MEWNKIDLLSKVPWGFSRRKTYPDSPYQEKHTLQGYIRMKTLHPLVS